MAIFSSPEFTVAVEPETPSKEISNFDLNGAFKEALKIGFENVVKQLVAIDGFNAERAIHIPLLEQLPTVKMMLVNVGMKSLVDDPERKLNQRS